MNCELVPNSGNNIPGSALANGFKASWFSEDVRGARGLFVVESSGEVMAIARAASPRAVVLVEDANNDGNAEKITVLAEEGTLTHGLVVRDNYIYASSDTTVFRWPYELGSGRKIANNLKEIVIFVQPAKYFRHMFLPLSWSRAQLL